MRFRSSVSRVAAAAAAVAALTPARPAPSVTAVFRPELPVSVALAPSGDRTLVSERAGRIRLAANGRRLAFPTASPAPASPGETGGLASSRDSATPLVVLGVALVAGLAATLGLLRRRSRG